MATNKRAYTAMDIFPMGNDIDKTHCSLLRFWSTTDINNEKTSKFNKLVTSKFIIQNRFYQRKCIECGKLIRLNNNNNNSNNMAVECGILAFVCNPIRKFFSLIVGRFSSTDIDSTDGRMTKTVRRWINRARNMFRRNCCRRYSETYHMNTYPRLVLPNINLEREYSMDHEKRGIALIFNQENFERRTNHKKRDGTYVDLESLKKTFEQLEFEVIDHTDLGTAKIIENLRKVASLDHSKNDCLVITILSHGELNKIFSRDDSYHITLLTSFFTDEKCPSLKGKPKIFLIQTCRGVKRDFGYKLGYSTNYQLRRMIMGAYEEVDVTAYGVMSPEQIDTEMVHNPPNHPDFLIVRSTMPNYVSYRNTERGSWFIQDLCTELSRYGNNVDILTLLTFVTNSVAMRESFPDKEKQIICTSSMLTKLLVFRSKGNLTQF